jgi:hypothetical protein
MNYKKWVPSDALVACEEKLKELDKILNPLNLERNAYLLLRADLTVKESKRLLSIEWNIWIGSPIEVRFSTGMQRLIYDGIREYDGKLQFKSILKNGRPSKCQTGDSVHIQFCNPVFK